VLGCRALQVTVEIGLGTRGVHGVLADLLMHEQALLLDEPAVDGFAGKVRGRTLRTLRFRPEPAVKGLW